MFAKIFVDEQFQVETTCFRTLTYRYYRGENNVELGPAVGAEVLGLHSGG